MLFRFSWLDTDWLSGRAVITSLVSMRSVGAMSRSVIRCVLRVLSSPDTITTIALYVSDSAGNVLSTNPERNLALNNVRTQQTFAAKVTVCRHVVSQQTLVSGLDHCSMLIIHREITTNIKHLLPAPLLETSTFSGVSLKTLLVLSHRLYLPSKSCALA